MRPARIAAIALLVIMLISNVACSSTPEFVTYNDSINGYAMSIPASWDIVSWGDTVTFYTAPSQCSGGSIIADVIAKDSQNLRLQTLYNAYKGSVEDAEGFTLISEDEITIGGIPAMILMYMYTDGSTGDTYQDLACLLLQGNTSWSLSFWCLPECWGTYEDTFNTMLNSFHVLN